MNTIPLILLVLATTLAIAWTVRRFARVIAEDGYGHRPPPRSHHDERTLLR